VGAGTATVDPEPTAPTWPPAPGPAQARAPPGPMPDAPPPDVRTPPEAGLCAVCGRPLAGRHSERVCSPAVASSAGGRGAPKRPPPCSPGSSPRTRPPAAGRRARAPSEAAQAEALADGLASLHDAAADCPSPGRAFEAPPTPELCLSGKFGSSFAGSCATRCTGLEDRWATNPLACGLWGLASNLLRYPVPSPCCVLGVDDLVSLMMMILSEFGGRR
jgi:hypothetical protein